MAQALPDNKQLVRATDNHIQRRENDAKVERGPEPRQIREYILNAMRQTEAEIGERARHLSYLKTQLAVVEGRIAEEAVGA